MDYNWSSKRCECNKFIIFLPTKNGKNMPVDAETVMPDDRVYDFAKHVSHFDTCRLKDKFKKQKEKFVGMPGQIVLPYGEEK